MAKIKNTDSTKCLQDCEGTGTFIPANENMSWYNPFEMEFDSFLTSQTYNHFYLREMKALCPCKTCMKCSLYLYL